MEESSNMFLGLNEKTKNESGGTLRACEGRANAGTTWKVAEIKSTSEKNLTKMREITI